MIQVNVKYLFYNYVNQDNLISVNKEGRHTETTLTEQRIQKVFTNVVNFCLIKEQVECNEAGIVLLKSGPGRIQ